MEFTTEIIEKYLLGQLSEADKKTFETELAKNADLRKKVEAQKAVMEGVGQFNLQQQVSKAIKQVKLNRLIKKAVVLTLTVAVIAGGAWYAKKKMIGQKEHLRYELNEEGNKNWSAADKNLESQFFAIDPKKDTILETKSGIIFQVKAGTFLNKFGETPKGPVEFEVKEAMTPMEIVKGGLNTMSEGKLLETGGMFYVNARDGKEVLNFDKSKAIKVHVPNSGEKPMDLFDGKRRESGEIDWVNPAPMKRNLKTVEITSLNFYPPHFLDTLREMGYKTKNKILTDSIYYSFYCREYGYEREYHNEYGDTDIKKDSIVVKKRAGNLQMPTAQEKRKMEREAKRIADSIADAITLSMGGKIAPRINGEKLFRQNCATCHNANSDRAITGPGLKGMFERAPSEEWLHKFIMNNEKMIKSGDAYARKIYDDYNKQAMNVFEGQLSDAEVDAIINYIRGENEIYGHDEGRSSCGIEPAMIHAIWDKKFNGTFLATKAFEERLQVIFKTCNAGILKLYIDNLDRELWELDEKAAGMAGEFQAKFIEFARRKDGGVDISDEQQKQLQEYFRKKQETYNEAAKAAYDNLTEDEQKKFMDAQNRRNEYGQERVVIDQRLVMEEYEKNLDEAYRQLGKEKPTLLADDFISGTIVTPGWKNVDRYVYESVVARTTLDYKDPETGKKAVIEYKEASVEVTNREKYDRVLCYLLPEQLSSFQLMKEKGNVFAENLNMTFRYSLIVVGYKGEQAFYWEEKTAEPKKYNVKLDKIDAGVLMGRINSRYNFAGTGDVLKDINEQIFEQKEEIRMKQIRNREEITGRLHRIVFPCYEYEAH